MMRYSIYAGLLIILSYSCNRKDDNPGHNPCGGNQTITHISSSDLQQCEYKTNSYWVYIDSVNNSLDSVSIVSFNHGFIDDVCGNTYEIHSFKTEFSSSSESTDYVVVGGGLFKDFDGTAISGTRIYDDFNTSTSMSNHQIEKFDSLFIFDQYYRKVLRVKIDIDHTENGMKSIYFNNSEFGFLRHDIYSDTVLVSQKILMRKSIER